MIFRAFVAFILISFSCGSEQSSSGSTSRGDFLVCGLSSGQIYLGDVYQVVLEEIKNEVNIEDDYGDDAVRERLIYYYDTIFYNKCELIQSVHLTFSLDTLRSVSVTNYGLDIRSTLEFLQSQFQSCELDIRLNESGPSYYRGESNGIYASVYKTQFIDRESIVFVFKYLDFKQ